MKKFLKEFPVWGIVAVVALVWLFFWSTRRPAVVEVQEADAPILVTDSATEHDQSQARGGTSSQTKNTKNTHAPLTRDFLLDEIPTAD